MDSNGKDSKVKPILSDSEDENDELKGGLGKEEDSESEFLLPCNGGLSKGPPKTRRKVQWNDSNGDKLAEILEFQPSDVSDSDDDDDSDACFCTIM